MQCSCMYRARDIADFHLESEIAILASAAHIPGKVGVGVTAAVVAGRGIGPNLSLARGRGVFAARAEDMEDMKRIASAATARAKLWAAAAGNPQYFREAVTLDPAFLTSADDLTALLTGFQQLLPMP